MTFFPVSVRKFTLDIFIYQKVTLVTLGRGISKSDIRGGGRIANGDVICGRPPRSNCKYIFFLRKQIEVLLIMILGMVERLFFALRHTILTPALSRETKLTPLKKKNGDVPGPLGDFVKLLVTERLFLFFFFFLKKISINGRFFCSKRAPTYPKKKTFCTKIITSYLF